MVTLLKMWAKYKMNNCKIEKQYIILNQINVLLFTFLEKKILITCTKIIHMF